MQVSNNKIYFELHFFDQPSIALSRFFDLMADRLSKLSPFAISSLSKDQFLCRQEEILEEVREWKRLLVRLELPPGALDRIRRFFAEIHTPLQLIDTDDLVHQEMLDSLESLKRDVHSWSLSKVVI